MRPLTDSCPKFFMTRGPHPNNISTRLSLRFRVRAVSDTSSTLLVRLRNAGDQGAWADFQRIYSGLIAHWVRRYGVVGPDSDDLTQDILVSLVTTFRSGKFSLDRSRGHFRSFLMVTVRNRTMNFQRARGTQPQHVSLIEEADHPPDTRNRMAAAEYRSRLLEECCEAVRKDFDDVTWDCFVARSYRDEPAKKIAERHGIPSGEVYRRAYKVLDALKNHANSLDPDVFPS